MKTLFLKQTPQFGTLSYSHIFISYEGIPLSFLCENEKNELFLGHCSEIRQLQRWIITPIKKSTVQKLIDQEITLRHALTCHGKVLLAVDEFTKTEEVAFTPLSVAEIPEDDLPKAENLLKYFAYDSAAAYLQGYKEPQKSMEVKFTLKQEVKEGYFQQNKYHSAWSNAEASHTLNVSTEAVETNTAIISKRKIAA